MILALSPHLDDAIFSVGGYLGERAGAGTQVQCLTIFTRSMARPRGFALACQRDKGLPDSTDYMALRRAEDERACARLGIAHEHWSYREAPHRGYDSAAALFAGIRPSDTLDDGQLLLQLHSHLRRNKPTEVLYPFGAGNHVDHLQLIAAVNRLRGVFPSVRFRQYYDMPYANKFRDRYPELGHRVRGSVLSDRALGRKVAACAEYGSQLGFQFGGPDRIGTVLGREEYLV